MSNPAAIKLAGEYLKRAVTERLEELTDAWKTAEDVDEREKLHAETRALIGLEDKLSGRIRQYTDD